MNESEVELVKRMQQKDPDAFDEIFERYHNRLFRMAYLISGNYADSEDIVQETFVKCYLNCRDLKDCGRFSSWLYQILTRTAWRYEKKRKREEPVETLFEDGKEAGGSFGGGSVGAGTCGVENMERWNSSSGSLESPGLGLGRQPLEVVLQKEERIRLAEAINRLDIKYRTTIILYYYNQLSTKEISRIMGCMEGTVKSRLHTARRYLKQLLNEEGEETWKKENWIL